MGESKQIRAAELTDPASACIVICL